MKKRMFILTMLLAGGIAWGISGLPSTYADSTKESKALETNEQIRIGDANALTEAVTEKALETETEENAEADTDITEIENKDDMGVTAGVAEAAMEMASQSMEAATSVHEVPTVASEYVDLAVAQVNNYVNVRSEPNTESEVLGKLYNNSVATVLEATEDGWYRVSSGNVDGYVKSEYVVVGNEELARAVGTRFATVTTTTLFVRSEPTTEASILTMVPEGDDLVVLDEPGNGWVNVSTVEGDGYVSSDYVTLSTEYEHAESKEEEEKRLAKEEAERQAAARAAEEARRAREEAERKEQNKTSGSSNKGGSSSSSSSGGGGGTSSSSSGSGGGTSSSNSGGGGGTSSSASGNGSTSSSGSASDTSSGNSSSNSISNGQAVVNYGMKFLGNPYVYGGTSLTNGADCSGFVQSVYAAFGVALPRNSAAQRSAGYGVSLSDIQPGDIVCYSGHVGIYAGNNTLLHASNEKTGITLTSPVTYRQVLAVRRIF